MKIMALSSLVEQYIKSANIIHDYLQLEFENGDRLNVFNRYFIHGLGETSVNSLVGLQLKSALADKEEIRLDFIALSIRIILKDDAFQGPEALEYISPAGVFVIWP